MDRTLELYIHIPFCVKKCNYCDFLSFSSNQKTQEDYVNALLREIHYYGPLMKDRTVSTIYIGGGTPSWLAYERMEEILSALYQNFQIAPDAEVSMECNPGKRSPCKVISLPGSTGCLSVCSQPIMKNLNFLEEYIRMNSL